MRQLSSPLIGETSSFLAGPDGWVHDAGTSSLGLTRYGVVDVVDDCLQDVSQLVISEHMGGG